jgi:hypothetical protein
MNQINRTFPTDSQLLDMHDAYFKIGLVISFVTCEVTRGKKVLNSTVIELGNGYYLMRTKCINPFEIKYTEIQDRRCKICKISNYEYRAIFNKLARYPDCLKIIKPPKKCRRVKFVYID